MYILTKLRHTPELQNIWNRVSLRKVTCEPRCPPCPPPPPKCPPPPPPVCPPPPPPKCPPPKQIKQNWVSYGFDYNNHADDTSAHHASFFFSVTLCLVFGGFLWTYAPDVCMRDWAQREAFLELRRREAGGLPPIDPNYVPKGKVCIPSDKEICECNVDIVI